MKKMLISVALCAVMVLGACAPDTQTSESFALDTICTQQVRGGNSQAAIKEVNTMLQRITAEYAVDGTLIGAVNAAAPNAVYLNDEALTLIDAALQTAAQTAGAFDPTIGPVSRLWDISGDARVPTDTQLGLALPLVDYTRVSIDGNNVSLQQKDMVLDLGGIAKGYAADLAVKIYQEHGVVGALLNLGGNIYAFGTREGGADWRIGLRDPLGYSGEYAVIIPVSNTSVVTSGTYERFFESGGQVYHHLFDPKTGYPAQSGLLAVTVICENSARADALSTAFFVLGLEHGLELARQMGDVEAVFFTEDKQVYVTDGLKESIVIVNEEYILEG